VVPGIWRSPDLGVTWTQVVDMSGFTAATARGPRIYVAVFSPVRIMRSDDEGSSWRAESAAGIADLGIRALLETRRGSLLAGTIHGVARSPDKGVTWTVTGVR